ncbi:aminotransferase class I/II-fold pyridoxal phosphate-dependent enzyme, partial [Streptobacillus felis]
LLIKIFSNKNENILLFDPEYGHFFDIIINLKRKIIIFELFFDGSYFIDFIKLEKIIKKNKVKMIIISNPHNPSGKIYTYDELKKISKLCKKYNVLFVSDEIHQDICFNNKHTTALSVCNKSIVLTSITKTFNVSGIKTSICLIKNKNLKYKVEKKQIRECYNIVNSLGLITTKICYDLGKKWNSELLTLIKKNRDYAINFMKKKKLNLKVYPSDSTYFLWINYESLNIDEKNFFNLLIKIGEIDVTRGSYFGKNSDKWIRVNIACDNKYLKLFLNSLEKVVNHIKTGKIDDIKCCSTS